MRKIITVLACVAVVLFAASCKTGPFSNQEDANNAFDKIYKQYRSSLILDGAKDYTVVSGDTLSAITQKNYGDQNTYYFPVIMLASNDEVKDPDLIRPGMKLVIPDLQKNLNNPGSRAKMKDYLKEIATVYNRKGNPTVEKNLIDLSNSL